MVQAEMAELADALRSGRSELTLIRVQVPVSASFFYWRQGQCVRTAIQRRN